MRLAFPIVGTRQKPGDSRAWAHSELETTRGAIMGVSRRSDERNSGTP